jgi:hypothetical protein
MTWFLSYLHGIGGYRWLSVIQKPLGELVPIQVLLLMVEELTVIWLRWVDHDLLSPMVLFLAIYVPSLLWINWSTLLMLTFHPSFVGVLYTLPIGVMSFIIYMMSSLLSFAVILFFIMEILHRHTSVIKMWRYRHREGYRKIPSACAFMWRLLFFTYCFIKPTLISESTCSSVT